MLPQLIFVFISLPTPNPIMPKIIFLFPFNYIFITIHVPYFLNVYIYILTHTRDMQRVQLMIMSLYCIYMGHGIFACPFFTLLKNILIACVEYMCGCRSVTSSICRVLEITE